MSECVEAAAIRQAQVSAKKKERVKVRVVKKEALEESSSSASCCFSGRTHDPSPGGRPRQPVSDLRWAAYAFRMQPPHDLKELGWLGGRPEDLLRFDCVGMGRAMSKNIIT